MIKILLFFISANCFAQDLQTLNCQAGNCITFISENLSNVGPEQTINLINIQEQLAKELEAQKEILLSFEVNYNANNLKENISSCEKIIDEYKKPKYTTLDDLKAMCENPELKKLKETEYDSWIPGWNRDKKQSAQQAYHRILGNKVTAVMLSRQAAIMISLNRLYKKDKYTSLSPTPSTCTNDSVNHSFELPTETIQTSFDQYRNHISQGYGDNESLSTDEVNQAIRLEQDLKKTQEEIRKICEDNFILATSPYLTDARMSFLIFNDQNYPHGKKEGLVHQITFCRYLGIHGFVKKVEQFSLHGIDGLGILLGLDPTIGSAVASASAVSAYAYQAANSHSVANKLAKEYVAVVETVGIDLLNSQNEAEKKLAQEKLKSLYERSEDEVTLAQNKAIEDSIVASIVVGLEAISLSIPFVGRVVLKKFKSMLANGTLAKMIAEGLVKISDGFLHIPGIEKIDLKSLPLNTVQSLIKAFKVLSKLPMANAAKVNVMALIDITDNLAAKFGIQMAKKFENEVSKNGRVIYAKYGCHLMPVLGTGVSAATWLRSIPGN